MRIIITGATGLVGRALARELLSRGHEVEAWTRSPDVSGPRLPPGCTVVGWALRCGAMPAFKTIFLYRCPASEAARQMLSATRGSVRVNG